MPMLLYPEELIIQVHVDLLNTNFISLLSDLGFKITFVCPPLTGCWNRGLILFLSQVIWIQRIREMIFRILMIKISVSNFCQLVEKSGSIVLRWLETYGTVLSLQVNRFIDKELNINLLFYTYLNWTAFVKKLKESKNAAWSFQIFYDMVLSLQWQLTW